VRARVIAGRHGFFSRQFSGFGKPVVIRSTLGDLLISRKFALPHHRFHSRSAKLKSVLERFANPTQWDGLAIAILDGLLPGVLR
jgi:hypothetical protein